MGLGPASRPFFVPCSIPSLRQRSEEHTSELQSRLHLVCRLLLEKKKVNRHDTRVDALARGASIGPSFRREITCLQTNQVILCRGARTVISATLLTSWQISPSACQKCFKMVTSCTH